MRRFHAHFARRLRQSAYSASGQPGCEVMRDGQGRTRVRSAAL